MYPYDKHVLHCFTAAYTVYWLGLIKSMHAYGIIGCNMARLLLQAGSLPRGMRWCNALEDQTPVQIAVGKDGCTHTMLAGLKSALHCANLSCW